MTPMQIRKLNAYDCVDEVENDGMDEGRFFVHLVEGYDWRADPHNITRTKSFGSFSEARYWLDKRVRKVGS